MKTLNKILLILVIASLSSCGTLVDMLKTRTEVDTYTITVKDTTYNHFHSNSARNRDGGVVSPSSRDIVSERYTTQYDSVVKRYYPDFIRLGLFEAVGTFGGSSESSLNSGFMGVFPDLNIFESSNQGSKDGLFTGAIYRFGIYEARLRWFEDAPDWTIGIHGFEAILKDARLHESLLSAFTPYIRKRFFLRRDIPYIAITPALGIGAGGFMGLSNYVNASVSLDVGSLAGVNTRFYVGFATGSNSRTSILVANNDFAEDKTYNPSIFYAGFGISMIDFLNVVPETYTEWKDHEHSGWDIGLAQISFLNTGSDTSFFASNGEKGSALLQGFQLKLINTNIAIPYLDNNFYVGTSLINLMFVGKTIPALAFLPIRIGYNYQILKDELFLEPHFEYGYYPSSYYNIAAKLKLKVFENYNLAIVGGYISNDSSGILGDSDLFEYAKDFLTFSKVYFGLQIGINDRMFFPEEIRYNK